MDSQTVMYLMLAIGVCFAAYLLYTRQFKWVLGVVRNAFIGVIGILGCNFLLASTGLAVGVNALTAFIVGILGLPGFMLLYVTQLMVA